MEKAPTTGQLERLGPMYPAALGPLPIAGDTPIAGARTLLLPEPQSLTGHPPTHPVALHNTETPVQDLPFTTFTLPPPLVFLMLLFLLSFLFPFQLSFFFPPPFACF